MIRLLESAREDLAEGYSFYERCREGLGDYFLSCLQADIDSLTLYAGIHEVSDGFHRMLSKRLPFAIYYLVTPRTIDVYAVLDCRRDPNTNVRRLRSVKPKT
ncbi:MAG: type II toxin-antitoxin system RelE/ParE family toxin [Planctomycetota bacterium]